MTCRLPPHRSSRLARLARLARRAHVGRLGRLALCALVALLGLTGAAAAAPKLQVLQADGRADARTRAKIDAAILALAKAGGENVIPGDITFTEAAAAVGCNPDDAACRNEVLGMLSVDEIVITTVTPKPGGFEVVVRRVVRGGASREAAGFVPSNKLDRLDSIAPLFSAKPTPAPAPAPAPVPIGPMIGPRPAPTPTPAPVLIGPMIGPRPAPAPAPPPPSAITTPGPDAPEILPGARGGPPSTIAPLPAPTAARMGTPGAPAAPIAPIRGDHPRNSRRLPAIGMVGAGALVFVGVVFWGAASNVQKQIDDAPIGTKAQLLELQDLETRGDRYAGAGNLFFAGGLILGGVSTYYFIKNGRPRAASARITPTVLPGGGGIALTIGGTP